MFYWQITFPNRHLYRRNHSVFLFHQLPSQIPLTPLFQHWWLFHLQSEFQNRTVSRCRFVSPVWCSSTNSIETWWEYWKSACKCQDFLLKKLGGGEEGGQIRAWWFLDCLEWALLRDSLDTTYVPLSPLRHRKLEIFKMLYPMTKRSGLRTVRQLPPTPAAPKHNYQREKKKKPGWPSSWTITRDQDVSTSICSGFLVAKLKCTKKVLAKAPTPKRSNLQQQSLYVPC